MQKSQVNPLRKKMQEFVSAADELNPKEVRERTSGGSDLSELVKEEREEPASV
jgi:hypothetical protein